MGAGAAATIEKRRILLVDDVELNRTLTEAVLRGATYEVDSVDGGASALAALEAGRYDLVLLDLEMPGLGGVETATAIRRRDRGEVRLAALSSRNAPSDRSRTAAAGMSAHIARPIAPHALLREIERVFCPPAAAAEPDCWERRLFDEWVVRLGAERMDGFLRRLLAQLRELLDLALQQGGGHEALHRCAHDVASTSGMLGFLGVTSGCRSLLEAGTDDAPAASGLLVASLERAIARLDGYFCRTESEAAA